MLNQGSEWLAAHSSPGPDACAVLKSGASASDSPQPNPIGAPRQPLHLVDEPVAALLDPAAALLPRFSILIDEQGVKAFGAVGLTARTTGSPAATAAPKLCERASDPR